MTPMQQILLGVGAKKTVYMDDVFSTYLWKGTGSDQTINTGLDMAGEGGMVWVKNRTVAKNHAIVDTVRGAGKWIESNTSDAEDTYAITGASPRNINSFTSTGFTLKSDDGHEMFNWPLGTPTPEYTSWNFRKTKGFFTICTWTGNYTAGKQISHDLGCVPGLIMVKCTSASKDWAVYHRATGATHYSVLNTNAAAVDNDGRWNDANPTSTHFTVGTSGSVNDAGETYVAYLFAGGESTAATARSVDFDGNDYLTIPASTDLDAGAGDVTIETWFKLDGTGSYYRIFAKGFGQQLQISSNKFKAWFNDVDEYDGSYSIALSSTTTIQRGQWYHGAVTRSGNTFRLFLNGVEEASTTSSHTIPTTSYTTTVGATDFASPGNQLYGRLSNFRYVKGTAVYTSSFKPPTKPLTNITNTKLLCCNNSSATGSTVTPGTITATGNPTASTDSPFDDPAGFAFGESGDQEIIKCGSYVGNGSSTGPKIFLGWEPQYILLKHAGGTSAWRVYDSMRGIVTGADDELIHPDNNMAGYSGGTNEIDLTSTGFKIVMNDAGVNTDGSNYVYMAIRRPDGYVGKPPELGTGVFAMDTGNGSSTIPNFDSGFPVDFAFTREPADTQNWYTSSRLTQGRQLYLDSNAADGAYSALVFDSNAGWGETTGFNSNWQSWMWKRHAGFDVVTWTGDDVRGRQIPHSLSKTPEMMWIKSRSAGYEWIVYHKGLNGGTNPEQKYLRLDGNNAEATANVVRFNNQAPTSTHFIVGEDGAVNAIVDGSGATYIAMLFASVDGISKVGYYTGNGVSNPASGQTITTGFAPRFLIVKNITNSNDWFVLDTIRGWGSGNDKFLKLNSTDPHYNHDFGAPTSNGFTLPDDNGAYNEPNNQYIYYAHA